MGGAQEVCDVCYLYVACCPSFITAILLAPRINVFDIYLFFLDNLSAVHIICALVLFVHRIM